MSIAAIIFSKNRAMQLDALLRSMWTRTKCFDKVYVQWRCAYEHLDSYLSLKGEWPTVYWFAEMTFAFCLQDILSECGSDLVCFLCDDDVFFRDAPIPTRDNFDARGSYSLRLGDNITRCHNNPSRAGADFEYAFSLDGHIYRTEDVRKWLSRISHDGLTTPNDFELRVNQGFGPFSGDIGKGPSCVQFDTQSSLVGIPHNKVSSSGGARHMNGSVEELNRLYLKGFRIDLDATFKDVTVDAVHMEIPFVFTNNKGTVLEPNARPITHVCPEVPRLCEDGEYRLFPCCETGMRSGGQCHDADCLYGRGTPETAIPESVNAALGDAAGGIAKPNDGRRRGTPETAMQDPNARRPVFSICHPTARLPKGWLDAFDSAMKNADHPELVEYVLCIDAKDEKTTIVIDAPGITPRVVVNYGRENAVEANNVAAAASTGSILINGQDDIRFPEHWDTELLKVVQEQPAKTVSGKLLHALYCGDPLKDEFFIHVSSGSPSDDFLFAPQIYSRARYLKQGYAFHPDYESMYADNDLTDLAYHDGVVIEARHLMFEQLHPAFKKCEWDEVYARENDQERYRSGRKVYERRQKEIGFKSLQDEATRPKAPAVSSKPRYNIWVCLPGEDFQQYWVYGWTQLWGAMLPHHSLFPAFGGSSNVYTTRGGFVHNILMNEAGTGQLPDFVLWIDDDNIITSEHLLALIADLEAHPDLGLVCGWCWTQFDGERAGHKISCGKIDPRTGHTVPFSFEEMKRAGGLLGIDYTGFPCVLQRASMLKELGPLAFQPLPIPGQTLADLERGGEYYGEDVGYCIRASKRGWKMAVDPRCKVVHLKLSDAMPDGVDLKAPPTHAAIESEVLGVR